ncbi:hypothetical protein [Streptococcus mutans]|uniref:hypothetical protein n=1 Tax=Streptococcus mutans TaxID=1309 RepID=UPI0002B56FFB|nr:hypothetical protein [Streptococcus mutans]EMB76458.1 hypothetical protein SMU41_02935 [Streptococcus mutans 2VS1]EMB94438.1 hypothetical protein SMU62_08948 [Streptococcus mutans M21]EMC04877.1 hypothetical protein SMU69_06777 [Streptococcus mutans NLML4]EMC08424.1 hypothetical protein SMU72_06780 [Streptococcus mutans NLML9]EMC38553.1 hypothetical protein SMU95_07326 [Streptococcus mutans B]
MFKKSFKILLYLLVILVAILPLFRNQNPLTTNIYNFISVANKDYYGVVLSALAILVTFLIFNSQNEKEKKLRFEDEQRRNDREEKEYLENRERRFASARPYFIVEKDNTAAKAKIKIFMEDNVPLENILVCERKLSDKESEVKSQIIGTSNSGDYLYEFSLNELEMIVIKCTTYFDEEIYFQYYTGDITIHYRMVENDEDLNYSKSLERSYLSDYLVEKKENYEPKDVNTEIYKQNIYSVAWERVAKKRFSQYRLQILESIVADKIFTGNKNLEILGVIEKDSIGEILGSSIKYLREHHKDFSNEIIIELLEVIKKYLNDYWYTTSTDITEIGQKQYFKGNLRDNESFKKYNTIFNQHIDQEVMSNYIDDLILFCQIQTNNFDDWLFRNLELYLNEHIEIAGGKIDIEIVTIFDNIRTDIKQILSKTL